MSVEFPESPQNLYYSSIHNEDGQSPTNGFEMNSPQESVTSQYVPDSPEQRNVQAITDLFENILLSVGIEQADIDALNFEEFLFPAEDQTRPREEGQNGNENENENNNRNENQKNDYENRNENSNENTTEEVSDGEIGDFKQSKKVGDCWLLSSIVAVNDTPEGKQLIKDSITDNKDGTYSVRFAGDKTGTTYTVTEKDLNQYNSNSDGDIDVAILEEAARRHYAENEGRDIGKGGLAEGIPLLTGLKVESQHAQSHHESTKADILNMAKEHNSEEDGGVIMMLATDTWITAEGKKHVNGDNGQGHMMAIVEVNEKSISYVDPYDSSKVITQNLDEFAKLQSGVSWGEFSQPAEIYSAPGKMNVHPSVQEKSQDMDKSQAEGIVNELSDLQKNPDGSLNEVGLYEVLHNFSGEHSLEQRAAAYTLLQGRDKSF